MTPELELSPADAAALLEDLTDLASRAAAAIDALSHKTVSRQQKADLSPVTAADEASEAVLLDGLAKLAPQLPVVSEEAVARVGAPALRGSFALVDPLDGTKEYISGRDDFVVNIAIVTGGHPILGVIAAPARGLIWRGVVGRGAERLRMQPGTPARAAPERVAIHTRGAPKAGHVALTSRSHLDPATEGLVARLPQAQRQPCGSALKFCLLAQGDADLYPRLAPTSEWDIASGQALVVAAGGVMTAPDGSALAYGTKAPNFLVPAFVAWGDPQAAAQFR